MKLKELPGRVSVQRDCCDEEPSVKTLRVLYLRLTKEERKRLLEYAKLLMQTKIGK